MKNPARKTTDELFDTFWQAYPRRVAKGAAEKAWKKLKPTAALLGDMIVALEWQQRQPSWRDIEFVPYPASWLNARRWEDEQPCSLHQRTPHDWRSECKAKHGGRCTNSFFHAAMMGDSQP